VCLEARCVTRQHSDVHCSSSYSCVCHQTLGLSVQAALNFSVHGERVLLDAASTSTLLQDLQTCYSFVYGTGLR
jgi:hypothetical protein